jgi:hypothetical protein
VESRTRVTGVKTTPAIVGAALTRRLRQYPRVDPVGAPLIASDALKCARRIGFRLFGVDPDIRYTRDELARFQDGDHVDAIAAEVFAREKNARTQIPFNWLPDVPLKGKADAGYRTTIGRKVIVEVKSQNERGWSRAVGLWDGIPAAPKVEWVVQAGLAACSPTLAAELIHIVLVDNDRFEVAEWLIEVDETIELPDGPAGEPVTVRGLAEAEVRRQSLILSTCEGGTLPPRDVPGFGYVEQPPPRDDQHGEPWQCRFCNWQPTCARLDGGPVPDFGEIAA